MVPIREQICSLKAIRNAGFLFDYSINHVFSDLFCNFIFSGPKIVQLTGSHETSFQPVSERTLYRLPPMQASLSKDLR